MSKPSRHSAPFILSILLVSISGAVVLAYAASSPTAAAREIVDTSRIVSIGGDVTEIIYALGHGDRIVAVDATSQFPAEALATKKSVGYMRALSSEGVLSMQPTVIIANEGAGPAEVVKALKSSSVPYVEVSDEDTVEGVRRRIETVARTLGESADRLLADFNARIENLEAARASIDQQKTVLFILAANGGRAIIGGSGTGADEIIKLSGGKNAATGVTGYKPLADEALISMAPDAIIVMQRGGSETSHEDVMELRGVKLTPASQNDQVFVMGGQYLIGFGPRMPAAALDLLARLYPDLKTPGKVN